MALKRHIQHIGIALTQLLNTLLGGWPDESTSSRVYRLERQGRAYAGIALEQREPDATFGQPPRRAQAGRAATDDGRHHPLLDATNRPALDALGDERCLGHGQQTCDQKR